MKLKLALSLATAALSLAAQPAATGDAFADGSGADRKGGHVLRSPDGHLWGIDHGVSFHVDNKLRTVLWGWVGERLNAAEAAVSGVPLEVIIDSSTKWQAEGWVPLRSGPRV